MANVCDLEVIGHWSLVREYQVHIMGMYDIKQLVIDMAQLKTNSLTCKKNMDIEDIQKQLQHWWLEPRITTVDFKNSCFLLMAQNPIRKAQTPKGPIQGE